MKSKAELATCSKPKKPSASICHHPLNAYWSVSGKPLSSTVKANESAHVALNVLFSSETFLFLDLCMVYLPGVEKLDISRAGGRKSAVVTHILSDKKIKHVLF